VAIEKVLDQQLLAIALDGPLKTGLTSIKGYRHAERMLTAKFQPLIGKPGQSNSPNGQKLHKHANDCALDLVRTKQIADAFHEHKIHQRAVVEAFPTSFLGLMVEEPHGLKNRGKKTSDVFFEILVSDYTLGHLLGHLLPGKEVRFALSEIRNHDDRAALICAITALCVAANDYTALGDNDGWIILPPYQFVRSWALAIIESNATRFAPIEGKTQVRKLGLYNGLFPPMSLKEFNSIDEEIAALMSGDGSVFPADSP
jgi:hypothetical protein